MIYILKIRSIVDKYPFSVTFLSCFLFLFIRSSGRFINSHLWAEDGSLFLPDAIMHGWKSIFLPYAGYYHTVPRIIAYLTHFANVVDFPLIIVITSVVIYILIITVFLSDDFSYLIKERFHRFLICLSLCMAPGLHEVLGNLANLHWILFTYVALTSIRNPDSKFTLIECFSLLLAILSTGETVVIIPLLFVQLIFQFINKKSISVRTGFLFTSITMSVILNLSQRESLPQGPNLEILSILNGWYSSVINTMILQPIIGDKYVIRLFKKFWFVYQFGSPLIALLLVLRIFKQKNTELNYFVLIVILVSFLPLLAFIVRPYAMGVYANVHIVWNFRYAFILAPWGLFLYATAISTIPSETIRNYFFLLLFILYIFLNRYRLIIPSYGSENWKKESVILEQALKTGCPNHVSVPIYPDGTDGLNVRFYFKLDLPEPKIPCQ